MELYGELEFALICCWISGHQSVSEAYLSVFGKIELYCEILRVDLTLPHVW